MMISKISVIIQKICIFLSGVASFISIALLPASSAWRIGCLIALVASSVWHVNNTKCPHCERYGGLKPSPLAKDAGKCIHCGKLVEYK